MDAGAWETIRPNLSHVHEAHDWWRVVIGPIEAPAQADRDDDGDRAYLAQAADVLAALEWNPDVWKALTGALKEATGRKGKALFLPLRLALTGMEHGPDMGALLPLIGRDEALARLRSAV